MTNLAIFRGCWMKNYYYILPRRTKGYYLKFKRIYMPSEVHNARCLGYPRTNNHKSLKKNKIIKQEGNLNNTYMTRGSRNHQVRMSTYVWLFTPAATYKRPIEGPAYEGGCGLKPVRSYIQPPTTQCNTTNPFFSTFFSLSQVQAHVPLQWGSFLRTTCKCIS